MANEFREFLKFIYETTGSYPKSADSFKDIFIYVPDNKTPPKPKDGKDSKEDYASSKLGVSIQKYFATRSKEFSQLVYNDGWESLGNHLGPDLLRFCLTDCIIAKRTRAGSFMISNFLNLRNKMSADRRELKLNRVFYKTPVPDEQRALGAEERDLSHLIHRSDVEISTDDILFKICRSRKFPEGHTLVTDTNEKTVTSQVVKTRVGDYKIIEYEGCVEKLEPILDRLKKKHKKYNYEAELNKLIKRNAGDCGVITSERQGLGYQIPISLLKIYFTNIVRLVIPRELLGSNKNINNVVRCICDLLETAQRQSISLKPYIFKMRISDMRWLDGVKNTDVQFCMVGKLLKWLFHQFILQVFRTQLYVMVTNGTKKVYFMQIDWQKQTTQFLHQMCKDKVLVRINGLNTKLFCEGRWILFAKKNGVRPIMSGISGTRPRKVTRMALHYLQQLYRTKYGESGKQIFLEKWKNLVDQFRKGENKTLYLVCCDIQYAYGSIDQKKLIAIVNSLADSTGPELHLKSYRIASNLRAVKLNCIRKKEYIAYPEIELMIPSKSIFTCSTGSLLKVSKKALLSEIKINILNQNILMLNERYLLQKGIAQGAVLSSILCDMYYAHMESTHLSQFKDGGFLYRYVDDFLFATEDKALAESFLHHVNEGFPEYNCSFNAAKTRTNLPGHERNLKDVTFLGFNINPQTLEVTSDYSKSARYTTQLSKPRNQLMITFRKRLSNLTSLKLDGLVLDCKINSEATIIENVKRAFMRQAERCLWLLKALFDDIPRELSQIFGVIKSTNLQIIRHIQRYFLANGYDFEKLVPCLATMPWKAYRQVFGKMPIIHVHFRALFLGSIKMIENALLLSKSNDTPRDYVNTM